MSSRLIPLEACRGIAAIIVLVHHFFLGFAPLVTGRLDKLRTDDSLIGKFQFVFFNGTGAVGFFFALSGFVLCWSYFRKNDQRVILKALLKRWPRLAGIVTLITLLSFVLFKIDLYYFTAAASISSSPWLATFAYSGWSESFSPNFLNALFEGLATFFTGAASYNSNLWTMKAEFFGSLLVYFLAPFISLLRGRKFFFYSFFMVFASAYLLNDFLAPFVAGVYLAAFLSKKTVQINYLFSLFLVMAGLYLLGYLIPEKHYLWVSFFPDFIKSRFEVVAHTTGSILIIFSLMSNKRVFDSLNGKFSVLLGRVSFPIYLVHVLVICSISSFVFVALSNMTISPTALLWVTFVVTFLVSWAMSLPLMKFDDWWVEKVDRGFEQAFAKVRHMMTSSAR